MKKGITKLFILCLLILLCFNFTACKNSNYKTYSKPIQYSSLDNTDKKMLSQLNKILYKSKAVIWQDLNLKNRSFILVRKDESDEKGNKNSADISYYAINVKGIDQLDAQVVKMPSGFYFDSVYRFNSVEDYLSSLNENYSSKNDTLSVAQSENVFYFKYNSKNFDTEDQSISFSPLFTKQAFNYYIQGTYPEYEEPTNVALTSKEISYIGLEYKIMDNIKKECSKSEISKRKLNTLVSEYVTVEKEREELNEGYTKDERAKITYEGSAFYTAIRSARLTNTDFDLIYLNEPKEISEEEDTKKEPLTFSNIFEEMSEDNIPVTYMTNEGLNSIGAQLCIMLNNLNIQNWQEKINSSSEENIINIYDMVYKYYDDHNLKEISIDDIKDKYDYDEILEHAKKIQRLL